MRWIDSPLPFIPKTFSGMGLHPLVAQTLARKGITSAEGAQAFLDSESYAPAPASALPGMDAALERISSAIKSGEHICVWGDFDVDGQTSTSVLVETLRSLKANVSYHIPVRAKESHGVNIENLAKIIDNGANLIITCDTGISAHDAVEYASARGVDFVITDHHDLPVLSESEISRFRTVELRSRETSDSAYYLPNATAIINPKLLPEDHPLYTLAGVGVAYKLAEGLSTTNLQPGTLLDLVALGLVADLALLQKDCRYLVQKGLQQLRGTERVGLQAMMELAELNKTNLTEEHIGFTLAPRLNALGRLDDANPAVELLTTQDPVRARVIAAQLEGLNAQRKLLCDQVTGAAESQLRADPGLLAQPIIILHHPNWPGGVIGIAASHLVERYRKPAILLTGGADGILRGSARSVEGLHITQAITAQKDLLNGFGGHPMAAGLSLPLDNLPDFRRCMAKTVEKALGETAKDEAMLEIDGWISLEEATLELAAQLEKLAPFGAGNEKLTLAARDLTLKSDALLGKTKDHRKLSVEDENGHAMQVLWWNGGIEELPNSKFDLAFSLRASDWRGAKQVQLELIDFRISEQENIEIKAPKNEILDYRANSNKEEMLSKFRLQHSTAIWIEGEDKKKLNGLNRYELPECETLVIWSTPPSPAVLRAAMAQTKAKKIVLFAVNPATDEPKAFLERLAGLVKFAINKKGGNTSIVQLAAACAQGETAIRLGLDWLVKRGQVEVEIDSGGELWLASGPGAESSPETDQILDSLKKILQETAAYRTYFTGGNLAF